MYKILFKVTAT